MKRIMKYLGLSAAFVLLLSATGCGVLPVRDSGAGAAAEQVQAGADNKVERLISEPEDTKAKETLAEFFSSLLAAPSVEVYTEYSRKGSIPPAIKDYIAKKTLEEGEGNPEIGIHLPRFIEVNGMTAIGYDVVKETGADGKPLVYSGVIGKNGEHLLYFSKITLKAKCIPNSVFETAFKRNEDNSYTRNAAVDENSSDVIKLRMKYDVELVKENDKYKIVRAVESNIKPGVKNRLYKMNNESAERLPFLDITKKTDEKTYVNEKDGKVYEQEREVISEFVGKLKMLDMERMNLLSHRWKNGQEEIKKLLDAAGITRGKDSREITAIGQDYEKTFPYASFPLQVNMERIKDISSIVVTPHPAYSQKCKKYMVNFTATVQKMNGIVDEDTMFAYDYFFTLAGEGSALKISSMRLNEYYRIYK